MKKIYLFLIGAAIQPVLAQTNWPTYMDDLNINEVSARIINNSDFAWDLSNSRYLVPKSRNSSPLFAGSLWIGGYNNNNLHLAAMTYRQSGTDFWPGPLDTTSAQADTNSGSPYKKLYKINRFDIANFIYNWNAGNVQNGTFIPHSTILDWPAHGTGAFSRKLAPFVDVNNDGLYDPLNSGDYPAMRGDQMIWWIFNDTAGAHMESGGRALGVEVHASAYAFTCPNLADSEQVLNYTTFYHYEIYNRTPVTYDSSFIGLWIDADLGNYVDDYIGCDVMNNFGFIYNGDTYDENTFGLTGYHNNLPSFACNVLNGPLAEPGDGEDNNNNGFIDEAGETCLMNRFCYYTNSGNAQTGNPSTAQAHYNLFTGAWKDGSAVTYGGDGTNQANPPTKQVFPGMSDPYGIALGGSIANPITPPAHNWTQYTAGMAKNDMRFMIGVGPFRMQGLKSYQVDFALVFSQDSASCYGAANDTCIFDRAKKNNKKIKQWFDTQSFPSCLNLNGIGVQEAVSPEASCRMYPNPATEVVCLELSSAQQTVKVELIDVLGKVVSGAIFNGTQKYLSIPVADLAKGAYQVRVTTADGQFVRQLIKH